MLKHKYIILILFLFFTKVTSLHSQWQAINSPTGGVIFNLSELNGNIFANAIGSGVYNSTDDGNEWLRNTIPNSELRYANYMASNSQYVFASVLNGGIFRTSGNAQWQLIHSGKNSQNVNFSVNKIKIISNSTYLCTTNGLYHTSNNGDDWIEIPLNFVNPNILDVDEQGNDLYIINENGLYKSSNSGAEWYSIKLDGLSDITFYKLFKIKSDLYICSQDTSNSSGFIYNIFEKVLDSEEFEIFKPELFQNFRILEVANSNNRVAISSVNPLNEKLNYKIDFSTDNGNMWENVFDTTFYYTQYLTSSLAFNSNSIFAGTFKDGIVKINLANNITTFRTRQIFNTNITELATRGNDFFAGTSNNGIYYSPNSGNTWNLLINSPKLNPEEFLPIFKIEFVADNVLAATQQGLFHSTNNGSSWQSMGVMNDYILVDLSVVNNKVYSVGNLQSGSLFISNDAGKTWTSSKLPNESVALGLLVDGGNIFVTSTRGIFRSSDDGQNWINTFQQYPISETVKPIVKSGNNLLASSENGLYVSSDNGNNWTILDNDLPNLNIIALSVFGNYVFCSNLNSAYISINNGIDWYEINSGLGNFPVMGFVGRQNEVFAHLSRDAIYKTNLSDLSKIKIGTLTNSEFCTEMEIEIPFTVDPEIQFTPDNVFIAQLSEPNGKFGAGTKKLGTLQSSVSGIIKAKIPSDVIFGTGYRIRIVSSEPEITGIDNLYNLIILQKTTPFIQGENTVCTNITTKYTISQNPGFNFKWVVENGILLGDSTKTEINVRWLNAGLGTIKVYQQSILQCTDSSFLQVSINPSPNKPTITEIDSILVSDYEFGNQWYLDGNKLENDTLNYIKPTLDGIYTLKINNAYGCESEFSEPFNLQKNEDKFVMKIDDSQGNNGDIINLNLRLVKNKKYYELNVKSIRVTLVFNASLLYPLANEKGVVINEQRYIQLDIDTNYIIDDIVKVLEFSTMLGNVQYTYLTLENILINGMPESNVRITNGKFTLLDVCLEGGPRLVTGSLNAQINSLRPNPTDNNLNFEVINYNPSPVKIYIINTSGQKEKVLFEDYLNEGLFSYSCSVSDLSIGDYYLVLESENDKSVSKFIITR